MKFKFDTKEERGVKFLVIKTENFVDNEMGSYTQKGISSRNKIVSKLNYGSEYRWHNSILTDYNEETNTFIVETKIKEELFSGGTDEKDNSMD
jgi:hypothetical protein